ncbi:MAG: hypothetical protein IH869_03680 [Chloroflexi bacterium]|nr:hypothetical protein [Chloroflexota bacterium]
MSVGAQSRHSWLRAAGLALAVLGVLTIAACSGDEPTATATATPVPTATPTPVPTPTPTPAPDEFVLHIVEPVEAETLTTNPTLLVSGRTRVDAVVTVNDTFVDPDIDGLFSAEIPLDEGPNIIEVVASIATGEELSTVLVVIYEP